MRFTAVWSQTLMQNVTLRALLVGLCLTTIGLAAATVRLAVREPLIVERGCTTAAARTAGTQHSVGEIEAFVRQALIKRFDTGSSEAQLVLSADEYGYRLKEQQELKSRGIFQRVLVNSVSAEGTNVKVDADRILSASSMRSAVSFPLSLELTQTERTESNPYGLILARVSQPKPKEDSK